MSRLLMIIIGIGVAVAGGRIGLRALLYISVAFVAGFGSVSAIKGFFGPLSSQLAAITSQENAKVISFIILSLTPLISISYLGRRLIVLLNIDDDIPLMINSILGAGYAVAIYIIVLHII